MSSGWKRKGAWTRYERPQMTTPSLAVTGVGKRDGARRAVIDSEIGRVPTEPSSSLYNPRSYPQLEIRPLENVPEQVRKWGMRLMAMMTDPTP